MKKIFKLFLIVGASLLFIGGCIFAVAFAKADFNVRALSHVQYREECYKENAQVTTLNLDCSVADIQIAYADTDTLTITYLQAHNTHRDLDEISITEQDGVLSLSQSRNPYFSPSFFNVSVGFEISIQVPQDRVLDINVKTSTGDIQVSSGNFNSAEFKTSTGDMDFYGEIVADTLFAQTSSGEIDIQGNVTANTVSLKISTGDMDSDGVITAQTIDIKTGTGDVEIVLAGEQSDYTVVAKTNTGKQNIYSGGNGEKKLAITCSTGDIEVEFR